MDRLLITGISGFLGYNCFLEARDSWEIHGTVHTHLLECAGAHVHRCDLTRANEVETLLCTVAPQAVIHTAALADPNQCEQHRQKAFKMNVTATRLLGDWCRRRGIPLVFTSTDQVFNGESAPYAPDDPVAPVNYYGLSKVQAEEVLTAGEGHCTVCRLPLMFGIPSPFSESILQPMVRSLQNGRTLRLFTDEYRTPLSGRRAARGLLWVLKQQPGRYHLGGGLRVSRFTFGEMVARAMGVFARLEAVTHGSFKMAAPRPADVSLDSTAAVRAGFLQGNIQQELDLLLGKERNGRPAREP